MFEIAKTMVLRTLAIVFLSLSAGVANANLPDESILWYQPSHILGVTSGWVASECSDLQPPHAASCMADGLDYYLGIMNNDLESVSDYISSHDCDGGEPYDCITAMEIGYHLMHTGLLFMQEISWWVTNPNEVP